MSGEREVILVTKLVNKRIDCTCGVAMMPIDPSPEVSEAIKRVARESGARFRIIDTSVHPEVVSKYHIKELPAVLIEERVYEADEGTVKRVLAEITS
ncbi:MAG: hypothetical protein SCH39_06195 [Methanosarcinales archaeon]|nr:hypothetical protein [ANME-2 cluster archaeon]MDW7775911.1 hypothetical protein [Methanosarcinales archaeon]